MAAYNYEDEVVVFEDESGEASHFFWMFSLETM
jgi:hypothetical protein